MADVTSHIEDEASWAPFYYLRITGFPYYFFATINPTSTVYGASAWTLGSGYSAKMGMYPPDDESEQSLKDLIGGVATSERIRLKLMDFDVSDANGHYRFFGRLLAPGRALNDTSFKVANLEADLSASNTTSFQARGETFTASNGTVYLGSETIGYTGTTVSSSVTTFNTLTRNKFPCVGDFGSFTVTYPPVPYYRVVRDSSDVVSMSANIPVTSEPLLIVGRTAALYVGAMRPSGTPEPETSSMLKLVGRITSIQYQDGGFVVELESIMADLETARIGDGLARADFAPEQIKIPDISSWRSFNVTNIVTPSTGEPTNYRRTITIAAGTYTYSTLMTAINAQFAAGVNQFNVQLTLSPSSDGVRFRFQAFFRMSSTETHHFTLSPGGSETDLPRAGGESLLAALGFEDILYTSEADDPGQQAMQAIVADRRVPSVFFPTYMGTLTNQLTLMGSDSPGRRFFTDQNDGSNEAWARLSDGQHVRVHSSGATSVTLGSRMPLGGLFPTLIDRERYFYVQSGDTGSVEQVVWANSPHAPAVSPLVSAARFLCSNWNGVAEGDSTIDIYPEGVGLGWVDIVDLDTFKVSIPDRDPRQFIVDSTWTFKDIFESLAKEYGLFLVWNPADGVVVLRQLGTPNSANASTLQFTESNRPSPDEVSSYTDDMTHMRTGWEIRSGWNAKERKLRNAPVSYTDPWARNAYGIGNKHEVIEDKTLTGGDGAGVSAILRAIADRSVYYRYPWRRLERTVNKRGLTLSPGTVHKVVDNTIHNPYTGVFGITSADNVYGLLYSVSSQLSSGDVTVTLLLDAMGPKDAVRPWSPCALIESNAAYTTGSTVLTIARYFTKQASPATDAADFVVGDLVRVISRSNLIAETENTSSHTDTIAAVGATTVTLTTGLSAGAAASLDTRDAMLVLRNYSATTANRQATISHTGDGTDGLIVATARNHKWGGGWIIVT